MNSIKAEMDGLPEDPDALRFHLMLVREIEIATAPIRMDGLFRQAMTGAFFAGTTALGLLVGSKGVAGWGQRKLDAFEEKMRTPRHEVRTPVQMPQSTFLSLSDRTPGYTGVYHSEYVH